jgi:hypothetical protein
MPALSSFRSFTLMHCVRRPPVPRAPDGGEVALVELGARCARSEDCESQLVCFQDRCRARCAADGACGAGETCESDGAGPSACVPDQEDASSADGAPRDPEDDASVDASMDDDAGGLDSAVEPLDAQSGRRRNGRRAVGGCRPRSPDERWSGGRCQRCGVQRAWRVRQRPLLPCRRRVLLPRLHRHVPGLYWKQDGLPVWHLRACQSRCRSG